MKNISRNCIRAVVLGSILATAGLVNAQTETTTSSSTTTTSAGTVSDFSPDVITVRTDSSSMPTSYSYSKTTTYVDENGNPVSMDVVRSGAPVTVYYTQDGDRMVASKVVVRKTVTTDAPVPAPIIEQKKTTTTTTTSSSGQ
jgi:hypothetical protein